MSTRRFILVVEDDDGVARVIEQHLENEGYWCERVGNGESALQEVRMHTPDLILLDRVLPGISGDDVLRQLRSDPRTQNIPVIMLTGKAEESDELVGLALGADDYVSKPFSGRLLLARIEANLRRRERAEEVEEEPLPRMVELDRTQPRVLVDGIPVSLTSTEYKILATLMAAQGQVFGQQQLAALVFGKERRPPEDALEGPIGVLRRKMGPAGGCIQAVPNAGYAFFAPMHGRPHA
ncbi:MAG: response regulator [Phycisphaerae bacterium]|jgi:two-component system phosphate regulon response regulator PhoB